MKPREQNARVFQFFRERCEFVRSCVQADTIEGYIVWGASIGALSNIYAGAKGSFPKKDRQRFVRLLLELEPGLAVISIPLLARDIQRASVAVSDRAAFQQTAPMVGYTSAQHQSRIWNASEDREATPTILTLVPTAPKQLRDIVTKNRYADLLYEQYRCSAVHGLDLGLKTCAAFFPDRDAPQYMNYSKASGADYPTRICFTLVFLVGLLGRLVDSVEETCAANDWTIPAHPTLGT